MEPLLRRPNGRPQACEPCRKRKVACDHSQPVCRRCIKRKQEQECIYIVSGHDQVMRKPSRPPRVPSTQSSPITGFSSIESARETHLKTLESQRTTPTVTNPGYLGFTSFCGVYAETENSLISLSQAQGKTLSSSDGRYSDVRETNSRGPTFHKYREKCLAVLRNVPNAAQGMAMFSTYISPMENWVAIVARHVLKSFYSELEPNLRSSQNNADVLDKFAHKLCVNTTRPFSDEETDPQVWIDQLCGSNLRWESLGLLFNFWGGCIISTRAQKSIMEDQVRSTGWEPLARECFNLCYELCETFSNGNSVMLHLAWRQTVNESTFTGDASLPTWRRDAKMMSLLTYLGFHDGGSKHPNAPYIPSVSSEIKRRVFAYCFTTHMSACSFTGRPPLLCRRYTTTPLPLDISDKVLFSDEVTLAKALDGIDSNGWDRKGEFHYTTFIRARTQIAFIREEIFEVALGRNTIAPLEVLIQLKARLEKTVSEFPSCICYHPDDFVSSDLNAQSLYCRLLVELEKLQNVFFIERLLIRHGREDNRELLMVSFNMVTLTLNFWTQFDRLAGVRAGYEWLVMGFAAPAGGILSMELLKPRSSTSESHPGTNPQVPLLSRSSIVQKLSLLVGFLDWINPSAPNGDLCSECKSVIQRVLDQTLNVAPTDGFAAPDPLDGWDLSSTQLDFNFDLLDTYDWLRPDVQPAFRE